MAVKPVIYDDTTNKHRPLGSGEKMDGLSASSIISSQSGNLITTGSDGLAYATGSGIADPTADNLIEATSGGKLKVDMDRIVDWLDGHSSDASALADAINVVSADSGNVIAEGTDKGAYLSKAALANAIGSMSDAQLQALLSALADGQTIVASGGKLIVDPTNATAAKLKKITAVLYKAQGGLAADSSTGKLYVDFDAMSAATKRDIVLSMIDLEGGLAVHPANADPAKAGKIYVNFAAIDDDILRAAVMRMVQAGGGLAVDGQGQLYVDFENMPTDKFEAMLKSLKMQIPLESSLTFFVAVNDANAADTLVDGRGTEALPFKTVRACVNYVTQTYALGSYNILIKVKSGTYAEAILLPYFTGTSGSIYIDAYDINNPPLFVNATPNQSYIFSITGGNWVLRNINANAIYAAVSGDTYPRTVRICEVTENGVLTIIGGSYSSSYTGAAHTQSFVMHGLNANTGGTIKIAFAENSKLRLECYKGNATAANMFRVARGGSINFFSGNFAPTALSEYEIEYRGESSSFLSASFNATVTTVTGGLHNPTVVVASGGSAVGKPYTIDGGSGVYAPHGGFPGDDTPSLDATTYSWYKEV